MIRIARCLGLAFSVACLAACQSSGPLRVVVDPALAAGDVYEVSGHVNRYWGRPLSFGPFATEKTRVGETWTWTAGLFDVGAGQKVQPYRFVFVAEDGGRWQVECRAKTPILRHDDADDHGHWQVPIGETRLGCQLRDPGADVHSLVVSGSGFDFDGGANFGGEIISIHGLHDVPDRGGRPFRIPGVVGYELSHEGRAVASVDLLGKGRVYFARDVAPELRTPLAATATVLMFFNQG
jgi:hypothetical protein